MTKPTPLHNADLIHAAADGYPMQVSNSECRVGWRDIDTMHALHLLAASNPKYATMLVRVKPEPPRTITINGIIVPEPLQVAPEIGATYWRAYLYAPYSTRWDGDSLDCEIFALGICHATEAAAAAHANALLSFTRQVEAE